MSRVTDIILLFPPCGDNDKNIINIINKNINVSGKGFVSIFDANPKDTHWYGGTKVFQANAAIGAFNHLNLNELIKDIKNVEAELKNLDCDYLQMVIQEEEDWGFRLETLWI